MKYQLWYSESEGSGAFLHEDDRAWPKRPDARCIWTVEANSYDEARQKRNEFLERSGFEVASFRDPDAAHEWTIGGGNPDWYRSQTTRVTTGVYLDADGNQQSFEVPGWVGLAPHLAGHVAEATTGFSAVLGQVYIERPYSDVTTAPEEITVAFLTSTDGKFSMLQEFAGHIDDHALLGELVSRRVGPSISDWKFVQVLAFKRPGNNGMSSPSPQDSGQGVLHLIYTLHESEPDYRRIESDLNLVPKENRRLVLVFEDVLTMESLRERLDPSLRDLPPEILFEPSTVKRNKEALAIAYADAVEKMDGTYRAWNAFPAMRKQTIFRQRIAFNRHLLAWAADHGVELVRAETSLEAWLTYTAWRVHALRTDAAAARGDAATMWAENRKQWEACDRATQLRDANVNDQITRILKVERRGHDVLYVVGAFHATNQDRLVRGLEAVVHERRISETAGERLVKALGNSFDDQPVASREQLETLAFLDERLQTIRRPTASTDDLARLLDEIVQAAAARNITLRQVVDYLITRPGFQETARRDDSIDWRRSVALMFVSMVIDSGFISRRELEESLDLG